MFFAGKAFLELRFKAIRCDGCRLMTTVGLEFLVQTIDENYFSILKWRFQVVSNIIRRRRKSEILVNGVSSEKQSQ